MREHKYLSIYLSIFSVACSSYIWRSDCSRTPQTRWKSSGRRVVYLRNKQHGNSVGNLWHILRKKTAIFVAALVSLKDYPGEGEEEEEGKRKNRYGGRLSALSSCLAAPHCKHSRAKLEAVCRQRVALLRWYFVMPVVAMVTAEGGSHSLGDAMGIFLSTIPGCEINTEIKFHSLLPTMRCSPGSRTVTCKQTQSRTPPLCALHMPIGRCAKAGLWGIPLIWLPFPASGGKMQPRAVGNPCMVTCIGCKSTSPTFPRRKLAHARRGGIGIMTTRPAVSERDAVIQSAVCRLILFMLAVIQRLSVNTMTGASSVLPLCLPNTSSDVGQVE